MTAAAAREGASGAPAAASRSKVCPDCGQKRTSPETLRVHRWLAHNVKELPNVR